jgi:hypothetical protein
MTLQRLVITFTREGVEIRSLYRTNQGPNPGTKARAKEVAELARSGLTQALEALDGRVDVTGASGFETREDALIASRQSKEGAA